MANGCCISYQHPTELLEYSNLEEVFPMENRSTNFDKYLPVLPPIPTSDSFSSNISFQMDSFAGNNRTDFVVPSIETSTVHRHPILYGTAIYALFLIIIGTIGNGLTILILLRPNLRRYTTMRYLTAVAMADLCSLYSWNLNLFYKHLINPYQNDLEDSSMIACRLISFIGFVSLQLSSWYLTLVSIDRCLNIYFLFWNRRFGRASRSTWIILSITLIILLLNSHLLIYNGFYQENCVPLGKKTCFTCYARPDDRHYIFPKWEKVHVIIYNFIPFSIMLVCTCFIIRRSIPSKDIRRTLSTDSKSVSHSNFRQRRQRQVTCVLLSVISLFVALTTPVMIYNVFLRNHLKHLKPLKYIVHGILLCIQFTSHAINFFVYCYGASKFREELNEFFSCCSGRKRPVLERTRSSLRP